MESLAAHEMAVKDAAALSACVAGDAFAAASAVEQLPTAVEGSTDPLPVAAEGDASVCSAVLPQESAAPVSTGQSSQVSCDDAAATVVVAAVEAAVGSDDTAGAADTRGACQSAAACGVEAPPSPSVERTDDTEAASQVSAEPPAAPRVECDDEPVRKCARVEVAATATAAFDDAADASSQVAGAGEAVTTSMAVGA